MKEKIEKKIEQLKYSLGRHHSRLMRKNKISRINMLENQLKSIN